MRKYLPVLNLVALALSIVIHLASYTGFFPFTLQYVREARPIIFLPDSIALSTWIVIYVGRIAYGVFQTRPEASEFVDKASWYFLFTCIGKITWTILYIYSSMWMSFLAMVMTLAALVVLYSRLNIGQVSKSRGEYWVVHFPFSIHLAWVSVVTIVTLSTALFDLGFETAFLGISATNWTIALILFLTGLAAIFLFILNDTAFALTIAWGALTIFARPFDSELFLHLQDMNLGMVDIVAFVAFASLILMVLSRAIIVRRKSKLEAVPAS